MMESNNPEELQKEIRRLKKRNRIMLIYIIASFVIMLYNLIASSI